MTPPVTETLLTRVDPLLRLNDYVSAFKYYLSDQFTQVDMVVFVDNSSHPLSEIRSIADNYKGTKQVEILSFYGLDYPIEYTRGYGELKLIEYAFEHSTMINRMSDLDRIWKVTGRLKVVTLSHIMQRATKYFELCADFRYRRSQVDTRLIAFNIKGYKKFIYRKLDEMIGLNIESWLFNKLVPLLGKEEGVHILTEFRDVPRFEGFAGYMSVNYMSPRQRLIYTVRSVYLSCKYLFKDK